MKQFKPVIITVAILMAVTFLVPTLVVLPFSDNKASSQLDEESKKPKETTLLEDSVEVAVYRSSKEIIEKLPLEEYVVGVVAGEMPADFEIEALKAQALAARTFIVNQLMNKSGNVPEGADVTDTVTHQVFSNNEELKKHWGADYQWKMEKIAKAVLETKGKILTYEGNPIDAAFFSTSNGFTENSEAYWPNAVPYLKSVESPWDADSPKFNSQKVVPVTEFQEKLGISLAGDGSVGTITDRTPGQRVGGVVINGKEFTGREIREKLDLRSSDFTWYRKGDHIVITTKGFGHGVGMSQYGANGMAKEGKSFEEIVTHYYKDVKVSSSDTILKQFTAKK
ncbi:stage II sporulation protein D [Rossellomorea vietnamensis]|uniref:Stage II sporulation protein D n=1 Tax=Rossellomorea vietnamensis TaxID=218284 RepID=A0A5D4NU62_9BACI|nr:stage II sporulation protein D [Rossellomorea vietnamensis]TYS17883.1 stage II sporulation protein D [Rossellomorea vietnamensis]